jgi:hypothetical protein
MTSFIPKETTVSKTKLKNEEELREKSKSPFNFLTNITEEFNFFEEKIKSGVKEATEIKKDIGELIEEVQDFVKNPSIENAGDVLKEIEDVAENTVDLVEIVSDKKK